MSTVFLSKLSQNYIELLADNEYCDVTIEVGEDPNVKILRAHVNILCCRSPYLRRTLASNKKIKNNGLTHIKLPNISPEIFQIILKYIYGGILSLNDHDNLEIFKVLLAADELLIQELVDYLQKYFIENKSKWMEQHFGFVHRASFQSNSLLKLQKFCTDFMLKSPEKIFKSLDVTLLPEKTLVQVIQRDDLQMKEVEVWERVLKWGLAQNPKIFSDPNTWSNDDFKTMKNTLKNCLPFINFFNSSPKDFQLVRPYEKLLKLRLYEELLNSHLVSNSKPIVGTIIPKNFTIDGNIDSNIVYNLGIITTILNNIDDMDIDSAHLKFRLLLRGSRDGFTPKKFHTLCDNKYETITFIKVKGKDEIIGGYNPLVWKSSGSWGLTKHSFIFSFKGNDINSLIISNIVNAECALNYGVYRGPCFGQDIVIYSRNGEFQNYNYNYCEKCYYGKQIRDTKYQFTIEDYEVFKIMV
ncbi:unnamed protein product [Rhizophagus irregularis]|nr:unnamed protein product [Rhizophagus irregularis]